MNKLRLNALLACLLLALGSSALANDPPKEPAKDAKKDEEKPAEPDLPSKPYPKNAVPKAFLPKKDEQKEAAAKPEAGHDKPAEKVAEKPAEKADDKHAVVKFDGGHDPHRWQSLLSVARWHVLKHQRMQLLTRLTQ